MKLTDLEQYQVLEEREITDLHSQGYYLKHKKSGARIAILSNDDDNKVFSIGFRTPPEDSTGLPHILEHCVLCGSEKYPAKDPFVELVKGSLNTFLNAMTYPDKTVYPVASCNEKDFQNLMDVYMNSVFYTNIYEKEEIFRQEGWTYELESEEGQIEYNGVVYNEMKGAFSSPDDVLDRMILNSLFPDTPYAHESGGDPEVIPELKYSQFLNFHSKYYHPSNSYIYLYGDMDIVEKLDWLDQEYLSKYTAMPIASEITRQKPFAAPVEVRKTYAISSNEPEEDNTYLSYNAVVGDCLDKELYLAFQILDYALLSAPGAPLKQALLDAKIGKDISGSYENGILQPIFSVVVKGANTADKQRFLDTIKTTLEKMVQEGLDKKALKAGINYFEFRYREADYGNHPKGLMYGLQMLESWLYDESKPFLHIEALDTFEAMKQHAEGNYFEQLIQKWLIDNTHASVVIVEPEKGLTARLEQEVRTKLDEYKQSLSKEEIQELIQKTAQLNRFKEEPSAQEDLEKIPLLQRDDIDRTSRPLQNQEHDLDGTTVLHHEMQTNGIGYLLLCFELNQVPEELIPYAGILKSVLGVIDTENYKYGELFNEINLDTGGIGTSLEPFADTRDSQVSRNFFQVKTKVLYDKLPFAFGMIREILFRSKLRDEKRLYEIIAQLKSRLQAAMLSSGHSVAAMRSMSYYSPVNRFKDAVHGVRFYELVNQLDVEFDAQKGDLMEKLEQLMKMIFRPENLLVSYTADQEGYAYLEKEIVQLKSELYQDEVEHQESRLEYHQRNEGLKTSSKVQYVARSGNYSDKGYDYHGALRILKVILSYDYLWKNIRVQGGAYGCMSGFNRYGDGYLVSYRDPNLEVTNQVFEGTPDYIRNFTADEREMTKYIIGTVSDLDTPLTPPTKGDRSLTAYLSHISEADIQKERDEILKADQETIRSLAELVETVLREQNICVVGSEDKIENQKQLFKETRHLF